MGARKLVRCIAILALVGACDSAGATRFSREELLANTKPMGQTFMKLLVSDPQRSDATALRIERMFAQVLEHATRLRPDAEGWDWALVLVTSDAAAPFALPDGQIFVSPKWVASRRLNDAEIGLVLAHEMAHVIAEHMLARVSAFAAPRPRYLRVADVLRTLEQEWYLARELEPLIQSQELEADRIGLSIVCAAGISRRRALTLFNKMARAERATSYIHTHAEPLERKAALADWSRAQGLPCVD
jgi:predicted Zn-dependent protease